MRTCFFISCLIALQKTPSLLGAECQGVGTTPLHANERGQTVRFGAVIEPPVYWGISIVWGTRLMRSFLNTKKAFLFLRKAFVL